MTQRIIEITSPFFLTEDDLRQSGDPASLFPRRQPLALEVGCGIGDFVLQMAGRRPEQNFLAIDIYNKGCLKTCRKVEEAKLTNVRVARIEARWLLSEYLPPRSLAAVYINCPDPWPKKRHRRRRLVNRDFLHLLLHYLRPAGDFFFATDFRDYALEVAEEIRSSPQWGSCLPSPYTLELPGYPISKYMQRFLDQGLPIYHLHCRPRPGLDREEMAPPRLAPGFRMPREQFG